MWCVCQSLWDVIVHENRQIRQSKCEQKNGFLPTRTDKFLLRVVFFEVQNVFGCQKLDLKTLLTSLNQCWSSEPSKHRHIELRLWQLVHFSMTEQAETIQTSVVHGQHWMWLFSKSNCIFVCDVILNGIYMYLFDHISEAFWYMHIFLF